MDMLNSILAEIEKTCITISDAGIKPLLKSKGEFAFFLDPVLNLNRNRVNAEIYKSSIRLKKKGINSFDDSVYKKIICWLLHTQNPNGSWNEIHSQYNQPSALLTSFVG